MLLKYCINVSHMLPDVGRKMDLLNSWPPAVGAKLESPVEVGTTLVDAVEVTERVLEE